MTGSISKLVSINRFQQPLAASSHRLRLLYTYYPHMPIGKVWIYRLLFFCLFVRLRISPARIKLEASNFARRFIGVQGWESPIFCKLCDTRSPKSIRRTNRPASGPRPPGCKHYRRDGDVNVTLEMRRS